MTAICFIVSCLVALVILAHHQSVHNLKILIKECFATKFIIQDDILQKVQPNTQL